jgi:hypothetical protein
MLVLESKARRTHAERLLAASRLAGARQPQKDSGVSYMAAHFTNYESAWNTKAA